MSRLTRDGTAEPVSRDQILRHARGQRNIIFPVQLTTSRIGNLTRLLHTVLYVMTIHTYIMNTMYSLFMYVQMYGLNKNQMVITIAASLTSLCCTHSPFLLDTCVSTTVCEKLAHDPCKRVLFFLHKRCPMLHPPHSTLHRQRPKFKASNRNREPCV